MSGASQVPNPLRGHVVSFPQAIPSREWLAQRALSADHLGAVWPMFDPTPRSPEDERAMQDIEKYRKADLFTPCRLSGDASPEVLADLKTALRLPVTAMQKWTRQLATVLGDAAAPELDEVSQDQLFYLDKFPREITRELSRARVVHRNEDGWLQARSPGQARVLLNALAVHSVPDKPLDEPRTLDTPNLEDLAQVAAARPSKESQPALIVNLPVISGLAATDTERLIEFRTNSKTEEERETYLATIDAYLGRIADSGDPAATSRTLGERLERDLQLASQSFMKRLRSAGAPGVALQAVSTFVPFPDLEGLADHIGTGAAVASFGIAGATSIVKYRRSGVAGFIKSAGKEQILQFR